MRPLANSGWKAFQQTRSLLPRTTRRFAGDSHGSHHSEPVNESLGKGFWVTLAAIPTGALLYNILASGEKPFITRWIESYGHWQNKWAETNALRSAYIQQAREDRNIIVNSKYRGPSELNGAEVFNAGSPYNVPAGHGINLDKLVEHYEIKSREVDAKIASNMRAREEAAARERLS
ncbi:hypothetical protein P152DRAFT_462942 [Eremomyces bilateralis CBS 781.70]|uniref:NADH-ubiquinone oxidoreductase 17.8 kDa subunit n=1 Tax=Eremomyces bilateralis CBS 781.70 TaxID=1392243 RepID=A0A6G1FQQ9_9PEZI|nr:uncharacterized protein P152DRAFT_462942 [Eremomyces bilateralis CBS 781.70]KAF1808068.1 hypothetical protein P152DRAFT_462942 [Eremomyces bilateralis CBS 781.70]